MKLKELASATDISERTIRYYISDGVFVPEKFSESYTGRKSYDYTENDVKRLKQIALLRKYGISIKDIKQLFNDESDIESMLENQIKESHNIVKTEMENSKKMELVLEKHPDNVDLLCDMLSTPIKENSQIPLVDEKSAYEPMYNKSKTSVKILVVILIICFVFGLFAVIIYVRKAAGGNVDEVHVHYVYSDIHSQTDIDNAINSVIRYFDLNFTGCTLISIEYAGDEISEIEAGFVEEDIEKTITLTSTFEVDAFGGDGSFNANSTYSGWSWTLKKVAGIWVIVNYGYA